MCYSFESSIGAWFISFIFCSYMLANPDKYDNWIPLFVLTFTQIQIIEALLWTNINNKSVNSAVTAMLPMMLLLQPLMNSYLAYTHTKNQMFIYAMVLYGIAILYTYQAARNDTFNTTVGPNGHLVWNRYDENNNSVDIFDSKIIAVIYLLGLIVPFFFMEAPIKYLPISVAILTFSMSALFYKEEFSSWWCYISVSLAFIAVLFPKK